MMTKLLDYLPLWIILLMVLGLWLLYMIFCRLLVPWIIRWYDGRYVVPTTALMAAAGPPGSGADVKILYSTNDRGSGGGCAVCLEEYRDGDKCSTIVACNHKFHTSCLLQWLIWHHTCPLCRITV